MKYTIYKITNLINGMIYIGKHQTNNINDNYMGSGKLLKRAQSKYNIENFKKEILYIFDTEAEMNTKEAELVTEEFCLREDTYNICVGGQGGFSYINNNDINLYGKNGKSGYGLENINNGQHLKKLNSDPEYNKDYRIRVSKGVKNYYNNGGLNAFKNKKHTEETKQKIGSKNCISQAGSKNSQFGSFWITDGSKNKKVKSTDFIPEGWYKGRVLHKSLMSD